MTRVSEGFGARNISILRYAGGLHPAWPARIPQSVVPWRGAPASSAGKGGPLPRSRRQSTLAGCAHGEIVEGVTPRALLSTVESIGWSESVIGPCNSASYVSLTHRTHRRPHHGSPSKRHHQWSGRALVILCPGRRSRRGRRHAARIGFDGPPCEHDPSDSCTPRRRKWAQRPKRFSSMPKGLPLYYYQADTAKKSQVSGVLAQLWPALVSAKPTASGVKGKVASVKQADGRQVTYNGHFLYTFVDDSPGHVTGQGVSNFFVATPNIRAIGSATTVKAAPAPVDFVTADMATDHADVALAERESPVREGEAPSAATPRRCRSPSGTSTLTPRTAEGAHTSYAAAYPSSPWRRSWCLSSGGGPH